MNAAFITGATGFIGANLVRALRAQGITVYALRRSGAAIKDEGVINVEGDILLPWTYAEAMKNCDTVFHAAGFVSFRKADLDRALKINVEGTRMVLEAALNLKVRKVVHLSACAVLGYAARPDTLIDETVNPTIPESNVYAYSKRLAEDVVHEFAQKGLDVSIANISTVYGAGDAKLNSGSIIKAIHEGKLKLTPPGGTSFVSADDLCSGLMLMADKGKSGERYIISSANMEYIELASRIASAIGAPAPKLKLPSIAFYPALIAVKMIEALSSLRKGGVDLVTEAILRETFGYKYFSSVKARRELGWSPKDSIEDAARKAFAYYRDKGLIQ